MVYLMRHTDMQRSPALREAIYRGTRSGVNTQVTSTPSESMGSVRRDLGPDGDEQPARDQSGVAMQELLDPAAPTAEGTRSAEIESRGVNTATETLMPGAQHAQNEPEGTDVAMGAAEVASTSMPRAAVALAATPRIKQEPFSPAPCSQLSATAGAMEQMVAQAMALERAEAAEAAQRMATEMDELRRTVEVQRERERVAELEMLRAQSSA